LGPGFADGGEGGIGGERGGVHPGFDAGAAPVAADDADGHAGELVDVFGEVVADGGEGAGGLGSGDFPAVILDLDGGGGRLGDGALDLDVTDQREVGRGGDVDRGVVGVGHGPFHVGLAGGDPHFAHEDVGEGDGVVALDDEIGAFGVGGSGVEFDHPFA